MAKVNWSENGKRVVSEFKDGIYHYKQILQDCGKASCKKCQNKIFHGPYWWKFWYRDGKRYVKYIGKTLKVK